jgi:hypothetical protein
VYGPEEENAGKRELLIKEDTVLRIISSEVNVTICILDRTP